MKDKLVTLLSPSQAKGRRNLAIVVCFVSIGLSLILGEKHPLSMAVDSFASILLIGGA